MNSIEDIPDDFIDEYLQADGRQRLLRLKKSRLSRLFFYELPRHGEAGIKYINPLEIGAPILVISRAAGSVAIT